MDDHALPNSFGARNDTAASAAFGAGCTWNPKDPRSCLEPDSCGCCVDPCVYFGVAPEDGCIDADVLCGG